MGPLVRSSFFTGSHHPLGMSLQNRSKFCKELQGKQIYMWSGLDLRGGSFFTKSHNSEKYRKVPKSDPKSNPRGGGKIDLVTPFASELVVWRRQLAQIRALADPRCKKRAQQAFRRPTNWSKTQKNTEKPTGKCPEGTQR